MSLLEAPTPLTLSAVLQSVSVSVSPSAFLQEIGRLVSIEALPELPTFHSPQAYPKTVAYGVSLSLVYFNPDR